MKYNGPVREDTNGNVAVLISPGYGAGWFTWSDMDNLEMLFCPELVDAVLNKDIPLAEEIADRKFPNVYNGGVYQLTVNWLPKGTCFYVDEYDGNESIREVSPTTYIEV